MTEFSKKQIYYRVAMIGTVAGGYDPSLEVESCFATYEEALEKAKEDVAEYGGGVTIHECKPIAEVSQGRIRVRSLNS